MSAQRGVDVDSVGQMPPQRVRGRRGLARLVGRHRVQRRAYEPVAAEIEQGGDCLDADLAAQRSPFQVAQGVGRRTLGIGSDEFRAEPGIRTYLDLPLVSGRIAPSLRGGGGGA